MRTVTIEIKIDPKEYREPDSDEGAIRIANEMLCGLADIEPDDVKITCGKTTKQFDPYCD